MTKHGIGSEVSGALDDVVPGVGGVLGAVVESLVEQAAEQSAEAGAERLSSGRRSSGRLLR